MLIQVPAYLKSSNKFQRGRNNKGKYYFCARGKILEDLMRLLGISRNNCSIVAL
jgi:hypothetical protein